MQTTQLAPTVPTYTPEPEPVRISVDAGDARNPKLKCFEGMHVIQEMALTPVGFNALIDLDLMRRPQSLKVGAMRNWVELDGELFRFDDGSNGPARLEEVLNQRYVSEGSQVQNVSVFANPASPTGFDLQFPARPHGFPENRRRHLNEETIQILQHPEKCRVLRKGVVIILAPPNLVFKCRNADLTETHLPSGTDSMVSVPTDDGQIRMIDLSQPIDLSKLSPADLAAVFNHLAVNRRAALASAYKTGSPEQRQAA